MERKTSWEREISVLESKIEAQEEIIVNLEKDIIDKQADIEKRIQTINNFSDLLGKGTWRIQPDIRTDELSSPTTTNTISGTSSIAMGLPDD